MLTFGLLGPLGPFLDLFGDGLDVLRGFFGGRGAAQPQHRPRDGGAQYGCG
jgi:hypothetical protein